MIVMIPTKTHQGRRQALAFSSRTVSGTAESSGAYHCSLLSYVNLSLEYSYLLKKFLCI